MKFATAIDQYLTEQGRLGRINSPRTEVSYRSRLAAHAEDVCNRDPSKTGRQDVKTTLSRWAHPNTQRHAHAVLTSFYDWACEEGIRPDNPARQVRRARKRPTSVYRLTNTESVALLEASMFSRRERWAIHLALLAGVRNQELRGLQARHFARPGFVHLTAQVAKGGWERWVPIVDELAPIVEEIATQLHPDHYVLCTRQVIDPPRNTQWREDRLTPASAKAVWEMVGKVARRAGITEHVHPHLLRHAFGENMRRHAGLHAAQTMLGHVSVDTTETTYTDKPSLGELAVSVHGFSYRGYPLRQHPANPVKAPTGIEPV